jgi:HK97 family phage portal protein
MANPCPEMSPQAFWDWTAAKIEVYGEAFWIKLRNGRGRQVTGFVPLHPSLVQIFRDTDGAEMYRHMGRPNQVFGRDDIVPFRMYNPDNVMRGISRLEPLRSTLMNEDSARRSMAATWKNGTNPTGVVKSERELGTNGRQRLKMAFQSEHQGTGNHGRVIVLEDGVEFEQLASNAVEMAYLGARELNRQEVATVMDLPPSSLQDMTHATFSNIEENGRSLYRDSLSSRITFIESVVDWEVGRDFNGAKQMKFAVAEQLRGSFTERAESVAKLVQCGVMKPSEARQYFDLNVAGPEADELYIQGAMVPLGQAPENASGAGGVDGSDGPVTHVPALPGGNSTGTDVPSIQQHVRAMGGLLGRGRTLQEAAREVIQKTGDQDGVREACEYLLERRIA